MVLINDASPESVRIGEYYVAKRRIPPENVVRVRMAVADEIERAAYEFFIERPISEALTQHASQDRIHYIVLTKGIPIRVRGTSGLDGSVASVDSELTLLYRKLIGMPIPPAGRIPNPYYLGDRPLSAAQRFAHRTQDIFLVTRLDGFTVDDVIKLIDRGSTPQQDGIFVLDQRAVLLGNRVGDDWLSSAAERLTGSGLGARVQLESSKSPATATAPVLGYYSWGSNDASVSTRRIDVAFAPGALAGMFVSTDARTFKEPPADWTIGRWGQSKGYFAGSPQSLVGDLIRAGVTGVSGHVAEPYLDGSARPQILFPGYVAGFNLVESFYLSIPYLSWQNVVIGDPLCAPFRKTDVAVEDVAPPADADTELPQFFSDRRLSVLASYDVRPEISRLMLKASARLLHADLSGAAKPLETVTEIEPTLNAAHFVLATIYDVLGEQDKSIERYRTILSTAPNDVRSLNNLAYALAVNKKRLQEALPHAQKAYNIAHDNEVSLTLDIGYAVAARKGTPPNVLPFAPVGYNVEAIKAQITDTLGWILHLLGDDAAAEPYLTIAGAGSPNSAEVVFHVAVVKAARSDFDTARTMLRRAIELDEKLANRPDVKELEAKLSKP
ncbi:MAG: TIGR03790 family protein [Vicinamibacterales bacterium]